MNRLTSSLGRLGGGRVSGAGGFLPTDIAGLQIWLDFADLATLFQDTARTNPVTSAGQGVAGVTNKAGNFIHHASNAAPIFQVSPNRAVWSSATNALIGDITANTAAGFTVISVIRPTSLTTNVFSCIFPESAQYRFQFFWSGAVYCRAGNNNVAFVGRFSNTGEIATNNKYILSGFYGGGLTSASVSVFKNQNQVDANSESGGTYTLPAQINTKHSVGAQLDGTNSRYIGDYYEYLFYSRAISPAEHNQILDYLNTKWSIY
jgi:hypothetical protein